VSAASTIASLFLLAVLGQAQTHVSFSAPDGGIVFADVYGSGERGVVLAHGGRLNKESWKPQAEALVKAGFHVLAFDFRGFGQSHGPPQADPAAGTHYFDVLGAVRYLKTLGAQRVSVVGGSMGGEASEDAAIAGAPGEIDRLVVIGAGAGNLPPEKILCPKLFIIARDDRSGSGLRLPQIKADFAKMPQPKRLLILDGSAHAQFLFHTEQGPRILHEIVQFLSAH